MLTINNPEQTDEEMEKYIKDLEHFKYSIFQREKGHEKETEHFQIFIIFSIGKRFSTIKNYFPTAHIEQAEGSNVQCRDYCSKNDTRVSGPFEIGEFAEERARNDIKSLMELISAGADNETLKGLYPNQYFRFKDKIERIRQECVESQFEEKIRNVEVTYVYGESGTGKTRKVLEEYGLKNVYRVTDYVKDPWFAYKNQEVVVFEEFRGQFKIWEMLNYLDIYPLWLPSRYTNKVACFTKIFISTNIPLSKQYLSIQETENETFLAFKRRIHNIVYVDSTGWHYQQSKAKFEQQKMELLEIEDVSMPF